MSLFTITTDHANIFKTLFGVLKDILPKITLEIISKNNDKNKSGLKIMEVDATKTVLINLFLNADKFNTFQCSEDKCYIGLNTIYLYKLLSSVNKNSVLTFSMNKNDNKHLKINITNQNIHSNIECSLKLINLHYTPINIPPQNLMQ